MDTVDIEMSLDVETPKQLDNDGPKKHAQQKAQLKLQQRKEAEQRKEIEERMQVLRDAFLDSSWPFPGEQSNQQMLAMLVEHAMKQCAEDRPGLQQGAVEILGQAIQHVQEILSCKIDAVQSVVNGDEAVLQSLISVKETAEEALLKSIEILNEANANLQEEKECLAGHKAIVKDFEKANKKMRTDTAHLETACSTHENALSCFETLIREGGEDLIPLVMKVVGTLEVDDSLIDCVPTALGTVNRGKFDNMVLEYLQSKLTLKVAALKSEHHIKSVELKDHSLHTQSRVAILEAAVSDYEIALQKVDTCSQDHKKCAAAVKSAEMDIDRHRKNIRSAANQLSTAKDEDEAFKEVSEAYSFLKYRSKYVEQGDENVHENVQ